MKNLKSLFPIPFVFLLVFIGTLSNFAEAQNEQELLTDVNQDGELLVFSFGDSITYGIGDGISSGGVVEEVPFSTNAAGYPQSLSVLTGVGVVNSGIPGEVFTMEGRDRLISTLLSSNADIFLFMEGTNDAIFQVAPSVYGFELQKALNVARIAEKQVVPITLVPPCCDREAQRLFTDAYSDKVRELALTNEVDFIDLESEWITSCPSVDSCSLLNDPEGLHPNESGYDFIAELVAFRLTGFVPEEEMESESEEE